MTLWSICPINSDKSVVEIQLWEKFNYSLVRKEVFNWAEFTVNADIQPSIDLNPENGYKVNHDPEYSWSLSQLFQTQPATISWEFPESMTTNEIEELKALIDRGGYVALDAEGWQLVNTDFYLFGQLSLNAKQDIPEEE